MQMKYLVTDKLHIYENFNDTSEFPLISLVFQCLELNLLLTAAENSSNLHLSGANVVLHLINYIGENTCSHV